MGIKHLSYNFMSTTFLGKISKLDSLQVFISQRYSLTIYIQTFRDLQSIFYGRYYLYVDNH